MSRRQLHAEPPCRDFRAQVDHLLQSGKHAPVVYFVRIGQCVKIGTTTNLRQRVRGFYLGVEDILAIESGDRGLETAYHQRFRNSRVTDDYRDELFRLDEEISVHVKLLRRHLWQTRKPDDGLYRVRWYDKKGNLTEGQSAEDPEAITKLIAIFSGSSVHSGRGPLVEGVHYELEGPFSR
jgi:hypothetical protein